MLRRPRPGVHPAHLWSFGSRVRASRLVFVVGGMESSRWAWWLLFLRGTHKLGRETQWGEAELKKWSATSNWMMTMKNEHATHQARLSIVTWTRLCWDQESETNKKLEWCLKVTSWHHRDRSVCDSESDHEDAFRQSKDIFMTHNPSALST